MVGYRYPVLPENLTLPLRRCALSDRRPYSTYCYVNDAVTIIISCHGSRRVGPPMPNCKRPLSIAGATHSLQWSEEWNSQEIQQRLRSIFCLFHILRNWCTPYLIAGSRRQKISCCGEGDNETETILDSYHHRAALSCWRVTFLTWPSHPRFIILWQPLNMGISDLIFCSARTNHRKYPTLDENN